MKISFNWLQDFIDLSDYRNQIAELAAKLTAAGLEVEGIQDQSQQFKNVVVAKLLKVDKHPNADKLTVCSVDTGTHGLRQIVCGAKNHKVGDLVIAALPGAILPGDFAIKKSKIRDVESLGMLCSSKELGLAKESEGLLILDKKHEPGEEFSSAFGFDDIIFDINVTPNRADCLSHKGLAMEISTLLARSLKVNEPKPKELGGDTLNIIKVKVLERELCPRYAGKVVKNVKVGPSPQWLKSRLESVGVKSINNVVDVTNYVLFEYGQPLHAFDCDLIRSKSIIISKANSGEKFKTLDGTELTLKGSELMIRDEVNPIAIAGIIGGENSGVSENTTTVFIESAFFQAQGVRRTSRLHGIDTDASYRFSRGINPEQTVEAMNRAAYLLETIAGGEVQKNHYDIYPQPMPKPQIRIKLDYVSARLGYNVLSPDFTNTMKRLGALVESKGDEFVVIPSAARWDLNIPEDLIEEYARLSGYDKLGELIPVLSNEPSRHDSSYTFDKSVAQCLKSEGFYQATNYAFYGKKSKEEIWKFDNNLLDYGLDFPSHELKLKNPLSEDLAYMRSTLLPSLLQNLVYNLRHGNEIGGLFEIGVAHTEINAKYFEQKRLALIAWGSYKNFWKSPDVPAVFKLKNAVTAIAQNLRLKNLNFKKINSFPVGFHPAQSVLIMTEGENIGVMGEIHPAIKEKYKIRTSAAFLEINLDKLMNRKLKPYRFQEISKFPKVERDITFAVSKDTLSSDIEREITKAAGSNLRTVEVFDIFEGGNLQPGQKSVSYRLTFQSMSSTLSDELINSAMKDVINSIGQKLKASTR